MRGGQLRLERARFSAIESPDRLAGDAVQIRGGRATVLALDVQGCSGIGLLAAEGAVVDLTGGSVRGAGVAGLSADTEGQLTATGVTMQRHAGPRGAGRSTAGRARLVRIQARANRDGGVWAECSRGAVGGGGGLERRRPPHALGVHPGPEALSRPPARLPPVARPPGGPRAAWPARSPSG